MIVDASAIVAIMLDEPEGRALAARIETEAVRLTHPISVFEAAQAIARQWRRALPDVQQDLREFLSLADIDVVEIGSAEANAAIEASARYGKGRHPAALNLGDCFSYACARLRSMPLLYKGDDFSRTDLA
jgi:ribonuclease VapC